MRNTWDSSNTLSTRALSSRACSSEAPKGFSMITRTSVSARRESPRTAQLADDHREEVRRRRQVERAVQRSPGLLVELVQRLAQLGVDAGLVERARHVPDVFEQPLQHVLVGRSPGEGADRLLALGAIVLVLFLLARHPHQVKALGQGALVGEVVQCGQQFAPRQISGRAEDDESGRRDRLALEAGDERVLGLGRDRGLCHRGGSYS